MHPVIRIKDTTGVTIENVRLEGANAAGGYHHMLVGQAGFDLLSSSHVSIVNVSVSNTFGDGLTAWTNWGKSRAPTSELYVNGLTVTNAGRKGSPWPM